LNNAYKYIGNATRKLSDEIKIFEVDIKHGQELKIGREDFLKIITILGLYNAWRSLHDPRLDIRFIDAVNFPEEYTLGSIPANATNFLASLNRSISPISEIIVAAIFSPIPGID
jgi:hypothetical protein